YGVVAERGFRLAAGGGERGRHFRGRTRDLHAAPAAAGGRLDQHGIADRIGDAFGLHVGGDAAVRTRNDRDAEALGGALRLDLVAHGADVLGLRTDELQ